MYHSKEVQVSLSLKECYFPFFMPCIRFIPSDTLFVFANTEFLYLDFNKDTWAIGDVKYLDGSPTFFMPENSAIIPIDEKIHRCKHSNFLVSGGVLPNG
jgi:hypothetical protein